MGRERKKVVFLLFEGPSDYNAFYIPISRLFEEIDEEIEVIYGFIEDKDQEMGDITSKYGVNPTTIEDVLNKIVFKPNLNREGLYPKDLLRVIQFVDMDGAYVSDDMIVYDESCSKTKYGEKIYTDDVDKIIERNQRKRANLDYLTNLTEIKVSSKKIPYEVYYSSVNLEHVISDISCFEGSKNNNAKEFCQDQAATTEGFNRFFNGILPKTTDISYDTSWEFIKQNDNSLKRFSNIGLLIRQLLNHN